MYDWSAKDSFMPMEAWRMVYTFTPSCVDFSQEEIKNENVMKVLTSLHVLELCTSAPCDRGILYGYWDNTKGVVYVLSVQKCEGKEKRDSSIPFPISALGFFICESENLDPIYQESMDLLEEKIRTESSPFTLFLSFSDPSAPTALLVDSALKSEEIQIERISNYQLKNEWNATMNSFSCKLNLKLNSSLPLSQVIQDLSKKPNVCYITQKTNQNSIRKLITSQHQDSVQETFQEKNEEIEPPEDTVHAQTEEKDKRKPNKAKGKGKKNKKTKNKTKGKGKGSGLPNFDFAAPEEDCIIQQPYKVEILHCQSKSTKKNQIEVHSKAAAAEMREISIETIWFSPPAMDLGTIVLKGISQILLLLSDINTLSSSGNGQACIFHPESFGHPISCSFVDVDQDDEKSYALQRKKWHEQFLLPLNRPVFRIGSAVRTEDESNMDTNGRLENVHLGLPVSTVQGGTQYLVQGTYEYYHYMQDRFNDNGWGCAYRSLQTICSWFRRQSYTSKQEPSHKEIQKTLAHIGDKSPSFIGSSKWIGAYEIALCLDTFFDVSCIIINFSNGKEIPQKSRELQQHFMNHGTPVMIGGGVLAYTLLGIDFNESTGETKYLILDPHYIGKEDVETIHNAGWCNWKEASLFRDDVFYNFCLPQCPTMM